MNKPFTTIDEQIKLLEKRGVSTNTETSVILRREGYYSIINGYKAPFIDIQETIKAGDDRYRKDTSFSDIYRLFVFDRELRELTFHYLIRIEALIRTACAYCFSDQHRQPDDYLRPTSYATEHEYKLFGLRDYADNLVKLTSTLQKRASSSKSEFVRHYREEYGTVPIWVLANDLTFGNIQHFFNLMKPSEQKAVCKHVAFATKKTGSKALGYFNPSEARASIDYLVKFRNNCAHDDRLYCAKVGPHHECDYATMLKRAERFLPTDEYEKMLGSVIELMRVSASNSPIMKHIIANMGFSTEQDRGNVTITFGSR